MAAGGIMEAIFHYGVVSYLSIYIYNPNSPTKRPSKARLYGFIPHGMNHLNRSINYLMCKEVHIIIIV